MVKRYFNLKLENKEVMGGVIKVDTSADLEHRLRDFYERDNDSYRFKHIESDKEKELYFLIIQDIKYQNVPDRDALGGIIGVPAPIKVGKPTVLKVAVKIDGELELVTKPEGLEVYLSEITKARANELKEGKKNWDLMRAYIFE